MKLPFGWRRNRVREEALAWLARLKRGLREKEGPELLLWLKRSRHRRTIARAAAEWHGPEVLAVLSLLFPIDPRVLEPPKPRNHLYVFGAMALFFLILIPGFIWEVRRAPPGRWGGMGKVYAAEPDKPRQVMLEDGSRLWLSGGTRVEVLFWEHIRSVHLTQGEALFEVRSAATRPFEVYAADRQFESDSAAHYDIRVLSPTQVELAVFSGAVVALPARWRSVPRTAEEQREGTRYSLEPVEVDPMQLLTSESGAQAGHWLSAADVKQRLAWQPGQ